MKIQTRMIITFVAVAFVPLVLIVVTFMLVNLYLCGPFYDPYSFNEHFYIIGDNTHELVGSVDALYERLEKDVDANSLVLEDHSYLESLNKELFT